MTLNPMASSSASSPPPSRVDFLRRDPNANIVAGAVGGLFSLVVGHPFDTVKVRLQTMTLSGASVRPYTGSVDCAFKMVSVEGFRSLYRGMGGMVYLALPRFALIFHANALGKKIYRSIVGNKSHTPSKSSGIDIRETLFGGIFSQLAIVPLLVVPLERVKVLMQTRHKEVGSTGQIECMRRIVDRYGVVGLYKAGHSQLLHILPSLRGAPHEAHEAESLREPRGPRILNSSRGWAGGPLRMGRGHSHGRGQEQAPGYDPPVLIYSDRGVAL